MQRCANSIASLVFFTFSLCAWMAVKALPTRGAAAEDLGADFFPYILVIAIALFSIILFVRTLVFSPADSKGPAMAKQAVLRIGLSITMCVVYAWLYEWSGFYISTALFSLAFLILVGEKRPWVILSFIVGMEVFLYVGFYKILEVSLPEGTLLYDLFPTVF